MIGNLFFSGICLENKLTKTTDDVNINLPGLVRKFIIYGLESGWAGENFVERIDGVFMLEKLGYDTSKIKWIFGT